MSAILTFELQFVFILLDLIVVARSGQYNYETCDALLWTDGTGQVTIGVCRKAFAINKLIIGEHRLIQGPVHPSFGVVKCTVGRVIVPVRHLHAQVSPRVIG